MIENYELLQSLRAMSAKQVRFESIYLWPNRGGPRNPEKWTRIALLEVFSQGFYVRTTTLHSPHYTYYAGWMLRRLVSSQLKTAVTCHVGCVRRRWPRLPAVVPNVLCTKTILDFGFCSIRFQAIICGFWFPKLFGYSSSY